jgi:hypothetical protein
MKIPNCLKAVAAFVLIASNDASGQIQQAWVARYNNGITNGTHQALKMALDSAGNICLTGFSQNSAGNLGYVTMKYAPNGNQLWATRYDSGSSVTPAAMVLDASNNVIVTGSALTVKYDPNGNQLWTAPYAGTALAVDSNGYVYVAGFSQNFATEKLTPQGSNVWQTTYVESYGPTVSQSVLVDSGNNVYVSGLDSDASFNEPPIYNNAVFVTLTTIKYGSNGNQIWKTSQALSAQSGSVQICGAALDTASNLYLVSNWPQGTETAGYLEFEYSSTGQAVGGASPNHNGNSRSTACCLDNNANLLMTGKAGNDYPNFFYGTYKTASNGSVLWANSYPQPPVSVSVATSIAVDSANNCGSSEKFVLRVV